MELTYNASWKRHSTESKLFIAELYSAEVNAHWKLSGFEWTVYKRVDNVRVILGRNWSETIAEAEQVCEAVINRDHQIYWGSPS